MISFGLSPTFAALPALSGGGANAAAPRGGRNEDTTDPSGFQGFNMTAPGPLVDFSAFGAGFGSSQGVADAEPGTGMGPGLSSDRSAAAPVSGPDPGAETASAQPASPVEASAPNPFGSPASGNTSERNRPGALLRTSVREADLAASQAELDNRSKQNPLEITRIQSVLNAALDDLNGRLKRNLMEESFQMRQAVSALEDSEQRTQEIPQREAQFQQARNDQAVVSSLGDLGAAQRRFVFDTTSTVLSSERQLNETRSIGTSAGQVRTAALARMGQLALERVPLAVEIRKITDRLADLGVS